MAQEVKADNRRTSLPGMAAFDKQFGKTKKMLAGSGGIPFEEFLSISPVALLG